MKVLIIGSGAREHALGWKIKQSPLLEELFFAPGNAGTSSLGTNIPIQATELTKLADWALTHQIDLTIVGPEDPLILGICEEFEKRELLVFGPSRQAAILEGSKVWTKDFLLRHHIPTASAKTCQSIEFAKEVLAYQNYPVVIKANGLAQGKGVAVCNTPKEAEKILESFMVEKTLGKSGEMILIEEFLPGEELSIFVLADGSHYCYVGEARDYKRAYDKDQGPNTGGMGAISHPQLIDDHLKEIIHQAILKPTFEGLKEENITYQGLLYVGLKLTPEGPKVLEFNVRFGDPETQVILPRIKDDLLPLLFSAAEGELVKQNVELLNKPAMGVVVAAKGYPGSYPKNSPLPNLDITDPSILLFHASTSHYENHVVNQGGRTLTAVTMEETLEKGHQKIYAWLDAKKWESFFYRHDIGLARSPLTTASTDSP